MKTNLTKHLIAILFTVLVVTISIANIGAALPAQSDEGCTDNWLHFGYDSAYTGYNPVESAISISTVTQLKNIWEDGYSIGYTNPIWRSPAIYNNMLFLSLPCGEYGLTAYNARTGQILWEFGNSTSWACQPVVSEDGLIFYLEGIDPALYNLFAIDSNNGNMLWQTPIEFRLGFGTAAETLITVDETNDLVYIIEHISSDGKLFAINKYTGEIAWYKSKATDNTDFKGDYVLLNAGKIYATAEIPLETPPFTDRSYMLRIDTSSQEIEFTFDRPEPEGSYHVGQYTLCNDKLIVGYFYKYWDPPRLLVAYDLDFPSSIWQKEFSGITGKTACNTTRNVLYIPTDPYLYAINATTGDEIWRYMGYGEIYNPSVANGIVYFLSDTNMYAIDEDTGERVFSYPLGHKAGESTQVAICSGMLYFSSNGGTYDLYALGLPDDYWLVEWTGDETDGGSRITTAELQDAIHRWLEDIPVRGHTMLTKDLQLVISSWIKE